MNQSAIVVGVGPGLGASLVHKFADTGFTVIAVARHATGLEELETEKGPGKVVPTDCDATSPEQVQGIFADLESQHGPLGVAVFNAGAFQQGTVLETEPAEFERCWRVGCFAGFLVAQAAARLMQARGRGTLIFTGATASLRGGAGFANLASPKFALRALAQSMARELGPAGIHVAHVNIDGQIRSPRYEELMDQRGPDSLLEPDAIADTYLALHQQHRSAWTHELELRPWVEKF